MEENLEMGEIHESDFLPTAMLDEMPEFQGSGFLHILKKIDGLEEINFLHEETAEDIADAVEECAKEVAEVEECVQEVAEEEESQEVAGEEEKSSVKVPNRGNGFDLEKYSWTQTLQGVRVNVPIFHGIREKYVVCALKKNHLKVGLKGQPSIIDGELFQCVNPGDYHWGIEDQNSITVILTKHNQMEWWKSLVKGDPETDTPKVEPEKNKLSDPDPETGKNVKPMMVYNRKKRKSEPSLWIPRTPTKLRICSKRQFSAIKSICNEVDFGNDNQPVHAKVCAENSHPEKNDSEPMPTSSNITPQKINANERLDLNKKTRQRKYMPKVFEDCKPKRTPKPKTPTPATPKRVISKQKSSRRKLNFEIENVTWPKEFKKKRMARIRKTDGLWGQSLPICNGNSVNDNAYLPQSKSKHNSRNEITIIGPHEAVQQENEEKEEKSLLLTITKSKDIRTKCNQVQNQGQNGAIVVYKKPVHNVDLDKKPIPNVDIDTETNRLWILLKDGDVVDEEINNEKKEYWEKERKMFGERVKIFISCTSTMQGNRRFSPWKGSIVDSVVGVFLTQNVSDHLSSSAYMELAAKFRLDSERNLSSCYENCTMEIQNIDTAESQNRTKSNASHVTEIQNIDTAEIPRSNTFGKKNTATSKKNEEKYDTVEKAATSKKNEEKCDTVDWDSLRKTYWTGKPRSSDHMDSVDWEAVRHAKVSEIASTIKVRGQHNIIAERIQEFLNRVVDLHEKLDLEWLRDVPPQETKKYLLGINGLGLKSVECLRLLTFQHVAFPVDTNVARIAVRLGWVPLKPLPEGVYIHNLEKYPLMDPIQKYLWPRLCHLDPQTLYELHYHMITFGKVFCRKKNPNCGACPMRGGCKHFASACASTKPALPGPSNKSVASSMMVSTLNVQNQASAFKTMSLPLHDAYRSTRVYEPIVEFPASPEHGCAELDEDIEDIISEPDIEDIISEPDIEEIYDEYEISTINLHNEQNLIADFNFSKALVSAGASIPMPKLKVSRLRTEHLAYVLPDSHPLLEGLDMREPDDPCHYLLALRTPGETASQESGKLGNEQEQNVSTVHGTILIPSRTAMRGRFALNGTYFQTNEVFADHESSYQPIDVPRESIWNLPRRTVFFGASSSSICRGLSCEEIAWCFWAGNICVRGFDRKSRAPRPLSRELHNSQPQKQGSTKPDEPKTKVDN